MLEVLNGIVGEGASHALSIGNEIKAKQKQNKHTNKQTNERKA